MKEGKPSYKRASCERCRRRKVKCVSIGNDELRGCQACRLTARFKKRDVDEVICDFNGGLCSETISTGTKKRQQLPKLELVSHRRTLSNLSMATSAFSSSDESESSNESSTSASSSNSTGSNSSNSSSPQRMNHHHLQSLYSSSSISSFDFPSTPNLKPFNFQDYIDFSTLENQFNHSLSFNQQPIYPGLPIPSLTIPSLDTPYFEYAPYLMPKVCIFNRRFPLYQTPYLELPPRPSFSNENIYVLDTESASDSVSFI